MKIAAYGCGQNYTSARFRVRQFIGDLATYDIHVHEYIAPIYKHLEPKSHNFTCSSRSNTLAGFTSLWITPFKCK